MYVILTGLTDETNMFTEIESLNRLLRISEFDDPTVPTYYPYKYYHALLTKNGSAHYNRARVKLFAAGLVNFTAGD